MRVSTLLKKKLPKQRMLVRRFLPVGLCSLAGTVKTGKSWLVLTLLIAIALGRRNFLGFRIAAFGRVLYYALEDSERRIKDRIKRLEPDEDPDAFRHFEFELEPPAIERLREKLGDAKKRGSPYVLVVIDTVLAMLRSSHRRTYSDVMTEQYNEMKPFQELAQEFGLTILLVDHARKEPGKIQHTNRGTTGNVAAQDTLWRLTENKDGLKVLEITGRDIEHQTILLRGPRISKSRFGYQVEAEGAEAEAGGESQRKIVQLLKESPGLSPGEIAVKLNKNKNTTRVLLKTMREKHLIERQAGKYYVHGFNHSKQPKREND